MAGLCLAMLIACFDGTIVGTCGPVIAEDLHGTDLYAWMVTAYLLCETVMIPIAGKLSDIYGRKPLFLIGLVLFMIGSVVAGMSFNMEMLILCRAIQGFGGGILIPVATAAVADLYPPRERGKMQGLLGALFGIGSGIGPLMGGYIEQSLSWHWIFYINVPLAIVCFILTIKKFPAPTNIGVHVIDTKGIALLSLFILDLLLLIEFGGSEFEWVSAQSIAMVVVAILLLLFFIKVEKKAVDPVLAPHLIENKTVIMSAIFMFIFGLGMMGAMTYASMFAITIFGLTTLEAGEWSLAMVAGMLITSVVSGRIVEKSGPRVWLVVGPILSFVGLYFMSQMTVGTTMEHYLFSTFILGLGLGCMMAPIMSSVQNSSKTSEMGMTTSSVNLIRSIGATMGTAVFAMIINARISGELQTLLPDIYDKISHDTGVLDDIMNGLIPPEDIPNVILAFANSVDTAFLIGGILILLLSIIGVVYKVTKPVDEEMELVKEHIESKE